MSGKKPSLDDYDNMVEGTTWMGFVQQHRNTNTFTIPEMSKERYAELHGFHRCDLQEGWHLKFNCKGQPK
jgi:hypothetical protein